MVLFQHQIAVIVYNKNTGNADWSDDLITMNIEAGDDSSAIQIPSLYIKASDGNKLKEFVESETTSIRIERKTMLIIRNGICTNRFMVGRK